MWDDALKGEKPAELPVVQRQVRTDCQFRRHSQPHLAAVVLASAMRYRVVRGGVSAYGTLVGDISRLRPCPHLREIV